MSVTRFGTDEDGLTVWKVQISAGFKADGKRNRPTCYMHGTKKEAQAEERQLYAKAKTVRVEKRLFSDWAEEVIKRLRKRGRAESTINGYQRLLNGRLLPYFGKKILDTISSADIAKYLNRLSQEKHSKHDGPLSGNTQLHVYRLLSLLFQEAVFDGLLTANPVKQVRAPRNERHQAMFHEPADLPRVWEALQTEPPIWRMMISTTLLLGLRRSELVGLQWQDIDFEHGVIHIHRGVTKIAGEPQHISPLKTATSARTVPMPVPLPEILKEWQQEQGGAGEHFVCAERRGEDLRWVNIDDVTRWYTDFTRRHELPHVTLHGLRHTFVTTLVSAGMTFSDVAELAGHSTPVVTAAIYSHATNGLHERAMNAMTGALESK